jgi:hypothetical protein
VVAEFIKQGNLITDIADRTDPNRLALFPYKAQRGVAIALPSAIHAAIAPCLIHMDLSKFQGVYDIQCFLSFMAEPKVNVIGYSRTVKIDSAVDDSNKLIRPITFYSDRDRDVRAIGSAQRVFIQIGFHGTASPPRLLKKITGQAGLVFGFDPQTTDLATLIDGKEATVTLPNGVKIRLHSYSENSRTKGRFTISMSVPKTMANTLKDEAIYDLAQLLRLQASDDAGHTWRLASFNRDRLVDATDYDLDLIIPSSAGMMSSAMSVAATPTHLVSAPFSRTEQKAIPFEFDNVPLPTP